jgi:hypothetical protein
VAAFLYFEAKSAITSRFEGKINTGSAATNEDWMVTETFTQESKVWMGWARSSVGVVYFEKSC